MSLFPLERHQPARGVSWLTILGIVLVPLVVGGLLVWALWKPADRLDTMTAAIVNNDTPVEIDGQMLPLGRQLAAALVTGSADALDTSADTKSESGSSASQAPNVSGSDLSTNFTWVLTDADDAAAGLEDGSYGTVVTIPSNFSEAATSVTGDAGDAVTATIEVETSENSKLLDDALSSVVTQTATAALGTTITTTYLDNVYMAFNTVQKQIGDAAEGASTVNDGALGLSAGIRDLAHGAKSLDSGVSALSVGSSSLASGAEQVSTGASSLATGADSLAAGASSLNAGAGQVASGAGELSTGAAALVTASQEVDAGTGAIFSGVSEVTTGVDTTAAVALLLGASTTQLAEDTQNLSDTTVASLTVIVDATAACAETDENCAIAYTEASRQLNPDANIGSLVGQAATVASVADEISSVVSTSTPEQTSLVDGTSSLAALATELKNGVTALKAGTEELVIGSETLAEGANTLATGATTTADGAVTVAAGAASVGGGASTLAAGAATAASGAQDIARGAGVASSGATDLASGATSAAEGAAKVQAGTATISEGLADAAEELPTYTDEESDTLSSVAATPVETRSSTDPASLFGASSVPFFAVIALWLGALATFLVFGAFKRTNLSTTQSSLNLALGSYWPVAVIGLVQGGIVSLLLQPIAQLAPAELAAFVVFCMLTSASFVALNQGLAALFGGVGRFVSLIAVVVSLAGGLISTAPTIFSSIGDVLPLTTALSGLSSIVAGTGSVGGAVFGLVAWGALGVLLTLLSIARQRTTTVRQLAQFV